MYSHQSCEQATCHVQGELKPALARLRESRAARARELSEEVLAVQERLDAGLEALTERTEENAGLGTQACPCASPPSSVSTPETAQPCPIYAHLHVDTLPSSECVPIGKPSKPHPWASL